MGASPFRPTDAHRLRAPPCARERKNQEASTNIDAGMSFNLVATIAV
jgi:hypothetical protein